MTSSSSQTPNIDEKKQSQTNNSSTNKNINIRAFIIAILTILLFIFLYFSSSGAILYFAKLTQANILPTDANCFPYSNTPPNIEPIISNIFYSTEPETGKSISQKIEFDLSKKNIGSHFILDGLRKQLNKGNSHFLIQYFISILQGFFLFNYSAFTFFFNSLNSIPETLLVYIAPFITFCFIGLFIPIIETIYFIYLWFASMKHFFKSSSSSSSSSSHKDNISPVTEPVNYMIAWGFVLLFFILFFFIIGFAPMIGIFITFISFLSLFGYSAFMIYQPQSQSNTDKQKKPIGVLHIIRETFIHFKVSLFSLFSFLFISTCFSSLGSTIGIISIAVLFLVYFNILPLHIFSSSELDMEYLKNIYSYSTETHQAEKKCNIPEPTKPFSLWNLFKTPSKTSSQTSSQNQKGGGGNVTQSSHTFFKSNQLDKDFLQQLNKISQKIG